MVPARRSSPWKRSTRASRRVKRAARRGSGYPSTMGSAFDFADFEHPQFGPQRGFLNIMRDFRARHGKEVLPKLHATSFVIASPEARRCMQAEVAAPIRMNGSRTIGGAMRIASGFMDIGNHSWDHVHHTVPQTVIGKPERDDFAIVDTFDGAEKEIREASKFIGKRTGKIPIALRISIRPHRRLSRGRIPPSTRRFLRTRRRRSGRAASRGAESRRGASRASCSGCDWRSPQELELLVSG